MRFGPLKDERQDSRKGMAGMVAFETGRKVDEKERKILRLLLCWMEFLVFIFGSDIKGFPSPCIWRRMLFLIFSTIDVPVYICDTWWCMALVTLFYAC
jgi:hypothetical protein